MILIDFTIRRTFNKYTIFLILMMFFYCFTSCVTQKKVEYLQEKIGDPKTFSEAEFPDYRLKSNDELYINIKSLDETSISVFTNTSQEFGAPSSPYGASLNSYSIDKEGYLLLPIIGNIYVKDKTLPEVGLILKDSLSHILSQPIVSVKLVNRYISVLGEVKNPGHFPYAQDKLSVYDAVGLAGDITDYGNRNDVILIRNINGENIRINMDITKSDILASDYYYLRPNDIVYVKPLREKFWGMRQFPWQVFFSALTTGLLIWEIVKDY
jgi:polysaccharide biosynthesis/export protein